MEDQVVLFKTAKLAEEKGFDETILMQYRDKDAIPDTGWAFKKNSELVKGRCSAPTQSFLQRWLRENHNIEAYIVPTYYVKIKEYQGYYGPIDNMKPMTGEMGGYVRSSNPEENLELVLVKALNLIKTKQHA